MTGTGVVRFGGAAGGGKTLSMKPMGVRDRFPDMPLAMRTLPVDHRGFPIPWFVAVQDAGLRDFRVADGRKVGIAIREDRCWVCGHKNNPLKAFVIGPMCAVNLTSSEPPSHVPCARFSARACPFLAKPKMVRREGGLPDEAQEPAGVMIKRNPGVTMLWVTRRYTTWEPPTGGLLFNIGERPHLVEWYAQGRLATRQEVADSITSGVPELRRIAEEQDGPEGLEYLARRLRATIALLPAA